MNESMNQNELLFVDNDEEIIEQIQFSDEPFEQNIHYQSEYEIDNIQQKMFEKGIDF